ncbi:large ribosomal subunit protein P2B-like [Corylus avellana]|uniref:large ribosomal subunit protein P2B-like n=1 Tax=Corylus avellana TaxID=13451 RepID=UPI00286C6AFC|nr:large ribosomal subunit protein P2B-like [Corylus avellana]
MKVIAAYLLAVLGGNTSPSAEDIRNILASVGAEADNDHRIEYFISQVEGKDMAELIAAGREKLVSVSSACSAAVTVPATTADVGAAAAEPNKEEKVEEEEEEEGEEEDMLFSIFD